MLNANRRMIALRHPTRRDIDLGWVVPITTPQVLMSAPNDLLVHDASRGQRV